MRDEAGLMREPLKKWCRGTQGEILGSIGIMEDEALGGLGKKRCAAFDFRDGRASKIGEFWRTLKIEKIQG